jgi:putative nucleotidyltransferase with HDIG domain
MLPPATLSRFGRIYISAVVALGFCVVGRSVYQLIVHPLGYQWFLLAALTLVSGSATVKLPSVPASISISEAFVFTAILLYGPAAGTLTVALDGLVISYWIAKRRPEAYRALFNMAAPALSAWCAAEVFFRGAGIPPLIEAPTSLNAILPYLFISAVSYFGLNSWLITLAISAETKLPALSVWRNNFVWLSLNYFCGASVAGLLVVYRPEVTLPYIGAVVPILVVIYFTFKTSMGRVEDANRHVEKINKLYLSTIETLAMAIDAKDQITHGHIRRVQKYATGLARELGVHDATLLSAIEAAALLHDMGKLAIPEYILNKPGKLTGPEFEQMKAHATIGADILSSIDFPYPVVPIVRHHHENWNGTGYPDGLIGTEIPIGARVLSVVDCFDALTSDRPYRLRLSAQEALQILHERRGTMYDPLVVDTFTRVYEQISPDNPKPVLDDNVLRTLANVANSRTAGLEDVAPGTLVQFTLVELSQLASASDPVLVGRIAADILERFVPFTNFVLFLRDAEVGELVPVYTTGKNSTLLNELRVPLGKGVSGWVCAHGTTLANSNPQLDLGEMVREMEPRPQSTLCAPIVSHEQVVGVITVYSPVNDAFNEQHARCIEAVARALSEAIARFRSKCATAQITSTWRSLQDVADFIQALEASGVAIQFAPTTVLLAEPDVEQTEINRQASKEQVLQRVLQRALLARRPSDVILRNGFDSIIVVLENASRGDVEAIGRRIANHSAVIPADTSVPVRVSVFNMPEDGVSIIDVLAAASSTPSREKPRHAHPA